MAKTDECPMCGWRAVPQPHPRHPQDKPEVLILLIAHIRKAHADEVARRAQALGQG